MELILKYFPNITKRQRQQLSMLGDLYISWNNKINLISRKDINNIYEHHILHSLSIIKVNIIRNNCEIIDIGTGGGLPGIPLAIMLPDVKFYLVDSIAKKIGVVNDIVKTLGLDNVKTEVVRAETINRKFDYIVSRSVMNLTVLYNSFNKLLYNNDFSGLIYLKGGDTSEEENNFRNKITVFPINNIFEEYYFETKKIVYIKKR